MNQMLLGLLQSVLRTLGSSARRWESQFYVMLAAAIALFMLADYSLQGLMRDRADDIDDQLIEWRLSSPRPSADILIVDIDERAMARLEREHGRWPWSRAVIAEALANIGAASPAAVLVNLHVAERDLRDPAGDAALAEMAESYPQVVFPFVRLPADNDAQSELRADRIPGARRLTEVTAGTGVDTVAAVLPAYESLQRRMGVANLRADGDGVIRRYPYWHAAGAYLLPSTVAVVTGLAGVDSDPQTAGRSKLNWRNKRGDYTRISFAELYADMRGGERFDWQRFAGKIVVIGITAPGIALPKATPLSPLTDDNLILATAIDDVLNDTALRETPAWIGLVIALVMLAALSQAFLGGVDQSRINRVFAVAQSLLVIITFFSVSYSNFILDLTLPFNAGLAYFAIAKAYYGAQHASERGFERFWDISRVDRADEAIIVVLHPGRPGERPITTRIRRQLEREVGFDSVLHLDDFVDARTFLGIEFGEIELLVAFVPRGTVVSSLQAVQLAQGHSHEVLRVDIAGLDAQDSRAKIWREVLHAVFPRYLGKSEGSA